MKKITYLFLILSAVFIIAPIASAEYATKLTFTNVTKTSATISVVPGNDEFATAVQSRQPVKMKYRKSSESKEIEIPFEYKIDANGLASITLSGLKPNQEYVISLGYRATRVCNTEELCAAIYTKYTTPTLTFKTKGDPVKAVLITKKLSYGDKSSEVGILKKYLAQKGYMKTSTTTTFDVPTLVGVIKFQMAKNLETDGVVGTGGRTIINQELTNQANLLNQ